MVDQTQEINKIETWVLVTSAPNTTIPQKLPKDMTFHEGHIVSIVTYSILMVVSGLANISVLCLILKRRRHSKKSSMMYPMLMHLAIADLLVTFLMMPLEIGWNVTVSWRAGDVMCRIMAFFRIFGLYLSGFVLMCISMDRYYAVLKPFSLSQIKRRGKVMLGAAWTASIICSAPQIMIFHVEKHPNFTDYEQCVTFNFFKSPYHDLAYKYFGLVMMYGLPLAVIIFCYSSILSEIYKKYKDYDNGSETFRRSSAGFLGRARIRTLKMTITIVTCFIVCWTPYYVMCLWYWMDRESAQKVDQRIQKALFIFASGNSMMNPIVYGIFNVRTTPPQKRDQNVPLPARGRLKCNIPDVVNGNEDAVRVLAPRRLWRIQWQRSFSDNEDVKISKEKSYFRKTRFRWRLHTQRSFSSEGTDIGEPNAMKDMEAENLQSIPVTSAELRRHRWRQKPQRSNLSDSTDIEQNNKGWRSWLSHHGRVSREEEIPNVEVAKITVNKQLTLGSWLSLRKTRQECSINDNQAINALT